MSNHFFTDISDNISRGHVPISEFVPLDSIDRNVSIYQSIVTSSDQSINPNLFPDPIVDKDRQSTIQEAILSDTSDMILYENTAFIVGACLSTVCLVAAIFLGSNRTISS
jgi:hypothetical protein